MPEDLRAVIEQYADLVDAFLHEFISGEEQIPNLHNAMRYALGLDTPDKSPRGKRLRPALGMMVCKALGGSPEDILPFAAAIEIFHNFTLVHDDIEDGDTFRRGRPCVYQKFGMAHGINTGDFMLVKVFRALAPSRMRDMPPRKLCGLWELMVDTLEHTHIGQALDMNARFSVNFSIEEYFRLVTEKTGYCLGASLIAAAIITDADAATRAALKEYALAIGPLFQIRDDVIDLTEGKGRERLGSDIREGKRSYLVAHVLSRCTSEERNQLLAILDAPRGETGDDDVAWVAGLFHTYGSFESAQKENERLLARAMTAAALMPLELGGLLNDFADLLLKRRK